MSHNATLAELLAKSPPHDLEAEAGVNGALLLDPSPELFAAVSNVVRPTDFYDDTHRIIFQSISMLRAADKPIDVTVLICHLRDTGLYDRIGGAATLARLSASVPNTANAEHYARILAQKSLLRKTIELAANAVGEVFEYGADHGVLEKLRANIDRTLSESSDDNRSVTLHEAATERLELMTNPDKSNIGALLGTGIECIDETYGGFRSGGSYVIAARPGKGKSALMKQICNSLDYREKPCLIISLEMEPDEIAARILAERTEVDGKDFEVDERGMCPMNSDDLAKVRSAVEECKLSVIHIYAPTGRNATFQSIAAFTRLMKAKHDIKLVSIDYMQIATKENARQSDYEHATEFSKGAKQLARELGIVVLLLSQFNRESEKATKQPRPPRLSDLRDSGAIEQDADGVIALHCEDERKNDYQLIVLKWRNDSTGSFPVRLVGEQTKFTPRPIEDHPSYHHDFAPYS